MELKCLLSLFVTFLTEILLKMDSVQNLNVKSSIDFSQQHVSIF